MSRAGEWGGWCSHILDVVESGLHFVLQKFALFALSHQIVCKGGRGRGQSHTTQHYSVQIFSSVTLKKTISHKVNLSKY